MMQVGRVRKSQRYSECSIHAGTVFLSGQVASKTDVDIKEQTLEVLDDIETLLHEAGSNKDRILMAQIFLADMADYDGMNEVWDEWVSKTSPPSRATVEAKLAKYEWKIEIVIVAAILEQNA
jgi:enamine deaminase RidA (YjgF/YER057c/UK114 family)